MRFAPLALVLALGLSTASAQPTIDGDLSDPEYILLDDNAGGPGTQFGVPTNGQDGSVLTAAYAYVDVPNQMLYLGFGGAIEANFNKLVVFLDTRDGGYNDDNFGANAGAFGNISSNFNNGGQFDPGFFADFVIDIRRGDANDGDADLDVYVDIAELAGTQSDMTDSINRSVFANADGNETISIAFGQLPDQTSQNTTDIGIELAIPFSPAIASAATPLVISGSSFSLFPIITSGDAGFMSNQTLSPADAGQGNFGTGPTNFGTLTAAANPSQTVSDPLAYTWLRTSATAGHRMVGAPFQGTQVRDFALQNHIQGLAPSVPGTGSIPNGGANFLTYGGITFGAGYRSYSSDGNPMSSATGNFWYLFDTMVSDRWVPLPFTLQAGGPEYTGFVGQNDFSPPADGTASYLRANPYASPFDTAFMTETTGYTLSNSIFVWDPDIGLNGDYVEYDRASTSIAERTVPVMSGFWADLTDTSGGTLGAPTFRFDPAGRVRPVAVPIAKTERPQIAFELELLDGADSYLVDRTTRLVFADGAAPGVDAFDSSEPPAISSQYARLSFVDGDAMRAVLGRELDPADAVVTRLAMSSEALGEQTYRLGWDAGTLPAGWTAWIRNLETGTNTNLRAVGALEFTATDGPATDRFELVVTPSSVVAGETASESVAEVLAPRPNPSTGLASMRVSVDRPQAVRVEAFDLLGRRVAVIFDGTIDTAQAVAVDASTLAPGLYVLRTTGETFATSHRFTVTR